MQLKVDYVKLGKVQTHPNNVRQGDVGAIMESLETHGQYRPIVVQRSTGYILAGNHTYQAAAQLGWSDIAVTYVDATDDEATRILLVDNRSNDLASYDDFALAALLQDLAASEIGLVGTGFDGDALQDLLTTLEWSDDAVEALDPVNLYTKKITAPQYEVVGEAPLVTDLVNMTKVNELHSAIASADLPDDVKAFLTTAAYRHAVFDYRKVAEFFPHQPVEIQNLMRDSVLVIIDFNDAISRGYVRLDTRLVDLLARDASAE